VVIVCVSVVWLLVGLVMLLAGKFLKLKPKSD
jgi:hypothetical protein